MRRSGRSRADRELEALVLRHRPLALRLARRYAGPSIALEDLQQVACLGLVKAARRFDPDRGFAFATYAVPTILGELRRYCRANRWVLHVPRPTQERARALRAYVDARVAADGAAPTREELAAVLACDVDAVDEAIAAASTLSVLSLDATRPSRDGDDGDGFAAADALGAEDRGYALAEDAIALRQAMHAVTALERAALRMRFAEDRSIADIAARLGIPDGRVSALLGEALERLRRETTAPPRLAPPGRRSSATLAA